jgi:integrin alpha FG-GAP repeat containing protein 1
LTTNLFDWKNWTSTWDWWSHEDEHVREEALVTLTTRIIVADIVGGSQPFFIDLNNDGLLDVLFSQEGAKPLVVLQQRIEAETGLKVFDALSFDDNFLINFGDNTCFAH